MSDHEDISKKTCKAPPRTADSHPKGKERTSAWDAIGLEPANHSIKSDTIGRYAIRKCLGKGAFGVVYLGFDPELKRAVAIKVPFGAGMQSDFRERFLREARAAATIHHPNVCPIYDVGAHQDVPYIVMRYISGGTLARLLTASKKPLQTSYVAAVVRKIALGVSSAHTKGILHRDLKPANILWDKENREVLITDFGLARIAGENQISQTGDILGTPAYMSPEQARGRQAEVGPLTDIYSLGVILYQMLTGSVPFRGSAMEVLAQAQFQDAEPPSSIRPGIDSVMNAICMKAMARSRVDRHASAREFADALTDYLRGIIVAEPLDLEDELIPMDLPPEENEPSGPLRVPVEPVATRERTTSRSASPSKSAKVVDWNDSGYWRPVDVENTFSNLSYRFRRWKRRMRARILFFFGVLVLISMLIACYLVVDAAVKHYRSRSTSMELR